MISFPLSRQDVGQLIVPNQTFLLSKETIDYRENDSNKMVALLQGDPLTIATKNGHFLESFYFAGVNSFTQQKVEKTGETIILFVGRDGYHHSCPDLVDKYIKRGINVITFNYPGIGKSLGETTKQTIVEAGESLVDYLENTLLVPRHMIAVHGHSLGGGPAALVAEKRAGISVVNDRSFSKLSQAAEYSYKGCTDQKIKNILSAINHLQTSIQTIFNSVDWEFNTDEVWPKIQGKKCLVYHSKDPVITNEVSLYQTVHDKDLHTEMLILDDECNDPHCRGFSDQEINRIVQAIGFRNRLLEKPLIQAQQEQPQPSSESISVLKEPLQQEQPRPSPESTSALKDFLLLKNASLKKRRFFLLSLKLKFSFKWIISIKNRLIVLVQSVVNKLFSSHRHVLSL